MRILASSILALAILLTFNMPKMEDHKDGWKQSIWEATAPSKVYAATPARSCRCEATGKIINVGDSAGLVLVYCGEPDNIVEMGSLTKGRYSARVKPGFSGGVKVKGKYTEATVEGYIYEYYNTRLPLRIYVLGGQIVDITIGN